MCFILPVDDRNAQKVIDLNERHQRQLVEEIRAVRNSLETNTRNLAYAIVGLGAICVSTWALFEGKIDQAPWLGVMCVVLSPFFGEAIRRAISQNKVADIVEKSALLISTSFSLSYLI